MILGLEVSVGIGAFQALSAPVSLDAGCPKISATQFREVSQLPVRVTASKTIFDLLEVAQSVQTNASELGRSAKSTVLKEQLGSTAQDAYLYAVDLRGSETDVSSRRDQLQFIAVNVFRTASSCYN